MRVIEKVPLRVKGLVIKVSIRVEVSFEGEVGYASRWVGSGEGGMSRGEEGMFKGGGSWRDRRRRRDRTRGIQEIIRRIIGRIGHDDPTAVQVTGIVELTSSSTSTGENRSIRSREREKDRRMDKTNG